MPDISAIDEAAAARPGETLDAATLQKYLESHLPEVPGPLHILQFPGGYSNLTYLIRKGDREFVLRRPPFGSRVRGAHDMAREFFILSHLHTCYAKAPEPVLFCDDTAVLGAPFYLMARVRGVILRNARTAAPIPAAAMRRLSEAAAKALAELHEIDYAAAGLGALGRPEGYIRRQVDGWAKRYAAAETDTLPVMPQIAAWLEQHLPPFSGAALIHNDFKFDNLVLDPRHFGRIIAVLDWEMATIGDPLMDLGTSLGYWAEAGDPAPLKMFGLTSLPGALTRLEFLRAYEQQRGVGVGDPLFYYAFGLFKIAVIVQQIYARFRQGYTKDARFANLHSVVRACAETAARAIELGRIDRLYA